MSTPVRIRPAPETTKLPLPLSDMESEGNPMTPVDVKKVVKIHFVVAETAEEMFNAHTHGLEAYGHKEFQVLVPGFCSNDAASVLNNHAHRVINEGERFNPGDTGEIAGTLCGYVEVPGDVPGDPTRLRIVHLPSRYYPPWRSGQN